jgi:hypothetical protein
VRNYHRIAARDVVCSIMLHHVQTISLPAKQVDT